MTTQRLRNWGVSALAVPLTVLAGCGDVTDVDFGAATTAQQAAVSQTTTLLSAASINEGGSSSVITSSFCVDNQNAQARVIVDWGDASADSVVNIQPGLPIIIDGLPGPIAVPYVQGGGNCPPTEFEVCSGSNCVNIPHTFTDDSEGAALTVNVLYESPPSSTTFNAPFANPPGTVRQPLSITIGNLAPDVATFSRSGSNNEGTEQTFSVRVVDPGSRPGEIDEVVIAFETVPSVAGQSDPASVTCTCAVTGPTDTLTCDDPATTTVSPCANNTFSIKPFFLDNRSFTATATVTDEGIADVGLTDTATLSGIVMANQSPTPFIHFTDAETDLPGGATPLGLNDTLISAISGTPTTVIEGFNYGIEFKFTDPGIDALNWNWNLATRDSGTTLPGPGGTMIFSRSIPGTTISGVAAANRQRAAAFDQGDTTLNITVTDDENASTNLPRFITVADVNPIISTFVDDAVINTVTEGSTVTFTVNARSGDFGSGFDPINAGGYRWEVEVDGAFQNITSSGTIAGRAVVAANTCTAAGTGGATGTDVCTITFPDADSAFVSNTYRVRVSVADEDNSVQQISETISVTNVAPSISVFEVKQNNALVVPATGILENQTVTIDVAFTDAAAALDGTYTLAVTYGDSDASTDVATLAAPGAFTQQSQIFVDNKRCPAASAQIGICTITAIVCEGPPGGNAAVCDSETFSLRVNNVAPTVTATAPTGQLVEGVGFSFNGSFDDPAAANDQTYNFSWNWSDNAAPRVVSGTSSFANRLTAPDVAGIAFVNVPAVGLPNTSFTLSVTDLDGGNGTNSVTANVRDNRPAIRITSATLVNAVTNATADTRENASVGQIVVAVAPETTADLLTTLTVNWGDTTTSVLTAGVDFDADGDTITITKPAKYLDNHQPNGAFTITVTVNDEDSSDRRNPLTGADEARVVCSGAQPFVTACQETTLNVTNVAPIVFASTPAVNSTIVVAEGQAATIIVTADDIANADIASPGGNGMTFTFDWGDGTVETLSGTLTSGADNDFDPGPGTISDGLLRVGRGAHIYSNPGLFDVTVTVTDKDGSSVAVNYDVDVINLAPVLTDLFATLPVTEGVELSSLAVVENRGADDLDFTFSTTDTTCNPVGGITDADFAVARPAFAAVPPALVRTQQSSAVFKTTFADNGTETICVRVCDDDVQTNSCVFGTVDVAVRNADPVLAAFTGTVVGGGALTEGGSLSFVLNATDVAADPITFAVNCGNGIASAGAGTSASPAVCAFPSSGAFTVSATASDGDGGSAVKTQAVTVANAAPAISAILGVTVNQGQPATFALRAVDAGNDPVNFQFNTGLITSTVASGATLNQQVTTNTTTTFTVRACDIEGACSATTNAVVTVTNLAPAITNLTVPSLVRQGAPFSVAATATDPGNDALQYEFAFIALDNAAPNGTNTGTRAFAADNTVQGVTVTESGRIRVEARARDAAGLISATSVAFIDVENVPGRLASFTADDATIDEGGVVVLDATANDPFSTGTTFTFAFDCGNGTTGTLGTTDALSAAASCTYAGNGNFVATVTSTDNADNTDTRSLVVVVRNLAPTGLVAAATPATINEGTAATVTASATDAGNDPLRFEYDFDNNGSFVTTSTNGVGSFRFSTDGVKTVNVRACDNDNACTAPTAVTVTVNNVAPVIGAVTLPTSVRAGDILTATVTASDVGNDPLTYAFTFTTGAVVVSVPAQSSPTATIVTGLSGASVLSVTVSDGTASTTATANYTVENEAPRIATFTSAAGLAVDEGGTIAFTSTATDRGGGELTFQIDCTSNGPSADDPAAGPDRSCTYGKSGTVIATVTVTDASGLKDSRAQTLLVRNLAPVLTTPTATSATITEGTAAVVNASATDAGNDPLRFEYDFDDNGTFEVSTTAASASFRFPEDGVKSVKVRACDDENACSPTSSVAITVTNVLPVINLLDVPGSSLVGAAVTVSVDASDVGGDVLGYAFEFTSAATGTERVPAVGFSTSPVASTTLRDVGSYSVKAIVRDTVAGVANTQVVERSALLTVTDISVNVTANANPAVINEGETTDITVFARGTGPYRVSYDVNADGDFLDEGIDVTDVECDGDLEDPCELTDVLFAQNRAGDLSFRVLVQVIDEGQNNLLSTAIVAVEVRNVAPELEAIDDASVDEDELFSITAVASDVGVEDERFFAVVDGPEGLTIDEETGAISWQPGFADIGDNLVEISVTDSDDAVSTTSFIVTVEMVDDNGNGISDGEERSLNDGELFCDDAEACDELADLDSDNDGVSNLQELLEGTDPTTSDAPGAPTIVSPINGVAVATATPTLTVANATNARSNGLTYTFCIVVDGGDDRCVTDVAAGQTTTSVVFDDDTALVEGTTYAWYAFASDAFSDGPNSEEGSFVVDAENSAPGAPDALSPANAAVLLEGSTVSLEARAVIDSDGDSISYVFVVANDAAFANVVTTSAARAVPLFTVDRALAVGTYFWRATASDGELSTVGASSSFSIAAIETNVGPTAPGIVGPSNETVTATTATLTITAGSDADGDALTYEFELADNAAFANAETSGAQAGLTFAVSDLREDSTSFWRARSFDGALYSDWSTASFEVNAVNGAPTGLAILSPTDGALLAAAPTTFVVSNASDVDSDELTYTFTIASDEAFANVVATGTGVVGDATTTFTATDASVFTAGVGYFWRVEATDGTGTSSAEAGFTVFKEAELPAPEPTPAGGGCGCSSSSEADVVGFALVGLVAMIGRRRRRA